MASTVVCPGCEFVGHMEDAAPGDRVQCPRCQMVIVIVSKMSSASPPSPTVLGPSATERDEFFASLAQLHAAQEPPAIDGLANTSQAVAPPSAPEPEPADDPQVERAWLKDQRRRLDDYF